MSVAPLLRGITGDVPLWRCLTLMGAVLALPEASAWPQGVPLGPEFRINTYTTANQFLPSLGSDAAGNFVVVWAGYDQDGSGSGVFGQRLANGGIPLAPEFIVNTYTTGDQFSPAIAVDGSGRFVVVWASNEDGSSYGIVGQRYDSAGVPLGPAFLVNTDTVGAQYSPAVASAPSGDFVVVWSKGVALGIAGQRYSATGAPLGAEFQVNMSTGCPNSPDVAVDGSGNFTVAWTDEIRFGGSCPFATSGILAQRYAASGSPLGPEFRVNSTTAGFQLQPSVAASAAGDLIVVWAGSGVTGQRFLGSGAPAGLEFQVGAGASPAAAMDGAGDFVVVWTGGDGSSYGVLGQRYAGSGPPSGTTFRVNTYTTSSQTAAAVASEPGGRFVVAWSSNGQDGSNYGVFGQRYAEIVPVELMDFVVD